MIEKVNPNHPDKVADRIAGAIVDLAYKKQENPKIAVEVLIGHMNCHIIIESSVTFSEHEVEKIVWRIAEDKDIIVDLQQVPQDVELAKNQSKKIRCGDNGIFKGMPLTQEQKDISKLARIIYDQYGTDGKYILTDDKFIVCQSHAKEEDFMTLYVNDLIPILGDGKLILNPLGYWSGGIFADTGATNRKLGSDMADGVTGGGLHGKDLSKADVSVNIYAFLKAQEIQKPVELYCAIGDETIDGKPYEKIVEIARNYIESVGGFEKFAGWGYISMSLVELKQGDCLELMKKIPDKSVDMILCDLPYGTTACKWDIIIPFEPLWEQYNRVIKDNGAIVLFGSEPFSSKLRMSNIKNYKYDWIWDKVTATGMATAKYRPMKQHEIISVFGGRKTTNYYPIMVKMDKPESYKNYKKSDNWGIDVMVEKKIRTHKYPKTILTYSNANHKGKLYPTQKPVELLEYLIKTYTSGG